MRKRMLISKAVPIEVNKHHVEHLKILFYLFSMYRFIPLTLLSELLKFYVGSGRKMQHLIYINVTVLANHSSSHT